MKLLLTSAAMLAATASATLPAAASPFNHGFGGPRIIRGIPPVFGGYHRPIYGIVVQPCCVRGIPVYGPWRVRGLPVYGPWLGGIPGPRGIPVERPF